MQSSNKDDLPSSLGVWDGIGKEVGILLPQVTSNLGTIFPNNQLKCKKWLGSSKNNISKLGNFKLLGWLATFFYGGIQAQS